MRNDAHKRQSIIIGLGDNGREVVEQFQEQFDQPDFSAGHEKKTDPDDLAIVLFGGQKSHQELAGTDSGAHIFAANDSIQLLQAIENAFSYLLKQSPVRDFSFTFYLDVFVAGAWRDAEFRSLLHYCLICIERIVRLRYGSVFSHIEERKN